MRPMIEKGWTTAALRRYILLEIPPLLLFAGFLQLLRMLTGLPLWVAGIVLGGWLIKDVILFFYTWPAYDATSGDRFSLLERTGIAVDDLNPEGYIRIRGERWRARAEADRGGIEAGQQVRVLDQEGLTLIVEPESPGQKEE